MDAGETVTSPVLELVKLTVTLSVGATVNCTFTVAELPSLTVTVSGENLKPVQGILLGKVVGATSVIHG